MNITWRQRVDDEPHLREIANWAILVPDDLPKHHRRQYTRNRRIVARILAGNTVKRVAAEHNVSPGRVSQLMGRCLGGDADLPPALAKGLLPHVNVSPSRRILPLPTLENASGTPGAFQQLLHQAPGLANSLDQMLEAKLKDKANAQTPSPQYFHAEFKRYLAAMHWPLNTYPYCTENCAYESVRRYFHQRMAYLRTKMEMGREHSFPERQGPVEGFAGRQIEIDEQLIDMHVSLYLKINGVELPIVLPRISVLLAVDVDTQCVLHYTLAIARASNQEDLLELLQRCLTPSALPTLSTPDLSFTPGANFPCNLTHELGFQFGTVKLDNAWMHSARMVTNWLCQKMGATVHYGKPKAPKVRQKVESMFHCINQRVAHRPASTTGSSPNDPIKASGKQNKLLPRTTFQMLDEMLCVVLTDYNVKPQTTLGGVSPLNAMLEHIRQQCCFTIPQEIRADLSVNINQRKTTIKKAPGQEIPYINFCYSKYYGECLRSALLEGKQIIVRFDNRDIRYLQAYRTSGEFLGELQARKAGCGSLIVLGFEKQSIKVFEKTGSMRKINWPGTSIIFCRTFKRRSASLIWPRWSNSSPEEPSLPSN